ncbi:MAG: C13 family peptidase [Nanoarchaeota archaeon]|nr:C13 family peptidase [Nanoarchaeota archaeon]
MRKEKGKFWTKYKKIQQAESTEKVQNLDGTLYAVLFNAKKGRHSYDIQLMYNSLIYAGVSDLDISVLEGDGRTKNRFVNKSATIKNLDSVVDSIRQRANLNDRLLIYVANKGYLVNKQCNVESYDGFIYEKDFEQIMQDLPVNFGFFYFAQCHSGGFAERMGYGRNIGMSNANREEKSYGHVDNVGAYFSHFLFSNILNPKKTIEQAFDEAVYETTSIERINNIGLKEGFMYPCPERIKSEGLETPQLRWQNADPSRVYMTKEE